MEENIHYLRLTIIKLIDQCAHRCIINDKPAFYNLCESAFEWAWKCLDIKEDYIYAEDFYALYDEVASALNSSVGCESPVISMLAMFKERTEPWIYEWEDIDET